MPTSIDEFPNEWIGALDASFIGRLSEQTRADLLQDAHEVQFPAKTVLYPESMHHRKAAHLVLILRGLVRVYRTSRSGREVTLRHGRRGDVLGLPSIVSNRAMAGAQSISPTKALMLSTRRFRTVASSDSQVAWAMAEEMAGSLFNIQERLTHNVLAPIRSRVARYLLDVATDIHGVLIVTSSHSDIAWAIGSAREVIARALGTLRREGVVRTVPNGIEIIDPDTLALSAQVDEFVEYRTRG